MESRAGRLIVMEKRWTTSTKFLERIYESTHRSMLPTYYQPFYPRSLQHTARRTQSRRRERCDRLLQQMEIIEQALALDKDKKVF